MQDLTFKPSCIPPCVICILVSQSTEEARAGCQYFNQLPNLLPVDLQVVAGKIFVSKGFSDKALIEELSSCNGFILCIPSP